MGTVDATPIIEEDILTQHESQNMSRNSQVHIESSSVSNDRLSGSRNSLKRSASPKDLRTSDASLADDRIATKKLYQSLRCNRCRKLNLSCPGKPGESCTSCLQNDKRCSFLEPRPYRCKLCDRDYSKEADLKGHTTRAHSREVPRLVVYDRPEARNVTNSAQSKIYQIPTSSLLLPERSSTNHVPDPSRDDTIRSFNQIESHPPRWSGGIHPLSQALPTQQQLSSQGLKVKKSRPDHSHLPSGVAQTGTANQDRDQSLPRTGATIPNPYQELNFEIFDNYDKRNLKQGYVQRTLDEIRENIDQYSEFVRGKDKDTSTEVREKAKFLDEVTPLVHLQAIDIETSEIFGIQDSRLVIALRSMFAVKDNTRLEAELENLEPAVRLIRLPHLVSGVLAYYLLQLFTEKDLVREAELKATELTHGYTEAANSIQHSRLSAQGGHVFEARLETRAKNLAPSLYDLIRPLTHWQQDCLHNGSKEQHLERLRKIILAGLRLATELEARKGTFSFHWPRPGERFDSSIHDDDIEDFAPRRNKNDDGGREKLVAFTLMPRVVRKVVTEELQYAKARVIVAQRNEHDFF